MGKKEQYGCKKCGNVLTVDVNTWSNKVEFRVDDGTTKSDYKGIHIDCKECRKPVLKIMIEKD